jgi:hypothetical protein
MSTLVGIGRRKFVSVSALADILKDLKEHGLPDAISRSSIKRARDSEFDSYVIPGYGAVVRPINSGTDENGDPCMFWLADSRACLYYMIKECPKLERFIQQRLLEHPCSPGSPWNIIIYNDEISPGNQLLHHNRRKSQAFYYSFMEFGAEALSSEFLWFTVSVARSDEVSEIRGLSFGTFSTDLMLSFESWSTEGFVCGSIIIWAKVTILVCDEAALKATLDVKGASGNLPCFKCRNVLSRQAFAKSTPRCGMVSITEINPNKLHRHTDESLRKNAEYLHEIAPPIMKVGQFKAQQIALGLNYNPTGVLLSKLNFKAITGTCYDPQHVYLVNGIWNAEVGQLLLVLKKNMKIKLSAISIFFHTFDWPSTTKTGKTIFDDRSDRSVSEKESSKHPSFSCSASDALGSFALLQEFLMLQVFGVAQSKNDRIMMAACASFFALSRVITLATMVPRGGISAAMLMEAIIKHMQLHKAAYGDCHWVPKFHYALHLPEQLEQWGLLIFCFTHERKHKEVKRYIQGRQNTSTTFEKNILQDVLHMQMLALREDFPYPRGTQLLSPRSVASQVADFLRTNFPGCTEFRRSVDAKATNFVTCHIGDVVYFKWDDRMAVGRINLLCSVDGECMACVQVWVRMPQNNMFGVQGEDYFVLLTDIVDTCVYRINRSIAYVVPPRGFVVCDLKE